MDGDTVFALATARRSLRNGLQDLIEIGAVAGDCLARAIARAVHAASLPPAVPPGTSGSGARWVGPPAWKDRFSGA
jgi:L-aminopeptidase/D-esterase-like protein